MASRSSKQAGSWAITVVHTLFISGVGLSTTFVNVYLWRHGGGLGVVLDYHVALFLALIPGGVLGGYLAGRCDRVVALRWGVAIHAGFFLTVLLLGRQAPIFAWPLGGVMGLGMGFYYVALSVMVLEFTQGESASRLVSALDRARLAPMTITPFVAAYIISSLAPRRGYPIVFAASFALFVAAALMTGRIARGPRGRPLALDATLWHPSPFWRRFLFAQGLRGVRDGVFLFLAGILVFERTRSEWELGLFALGSGAISWAVTWWVGTRAQTAQARSRLMAVGVLLSVASALALAAIPGRIGIALFGLLEAISLPLVAVPFSSESYALVGRDRLGERRGIGYMVAREVPLNFGRLVGVFALLLVVEVLKWRQGVGGLLVVLALVNVAAWQVLKGVWAQSQAP